MCVKYQLFLGVSVLLDLFDPQNVRFLLNLPFHRVYIRDQMSRDVQWLGQISHQRRGWPVVIISSPSRKGSASSSFILHLLYLVRES